MYRLQHAHILAIKITIHVICLGYIGLNYYWGLTDQLGADPVKGLIHKTGISALNLLLITLAITPLAKFFKQTSLIKLRRMLGLYCFAFATLHLSNYLLFDLQFDWQNLLEDIVERPYITVGFLAFSLLFCLAITSPIAIRNRLRKRWQTLHNTIYLIAILVLLHFIWSVKSDISEPIIYMLLFGLLIYMRKDQAKHWINKQIKRLT